MAIYDLDHIVSYARKHSEFYKEFYKEVPRKISGLKDLPVIDQKNFWKACSGKENKVITGPITSGIVFKSGGTTGEPKFSVFSAEEWQAFTGAFGWGMAQNGLKKGERIGNIFYVGELYASFVFIKDSLMNAPVPVVMFPIGGVAPISFVVKSLIELDIDVLSGVPTSIINIADYVAQKKIQGIKLKKCLFGSEPMYPDQRAFVSTVFPGIDIRSVGCASVDGGLIGYCDDSCGIDEHRVFGRETIMEIYDEDSGKVITEAGRPGKLLLTNLTRKLMPIIRYPVGDQAVWVEASKKKNRKFRLMGRSDEAARVGPMNIYLEDIRRILMGFQDKLPHSAFQLVITHEGKKDRMELKLAISGSVAADVRKNAVEELIQTIYHEREMFPELIEKNAVHPLTVSLCSRDELEINGRTGKLKVLMDKRTL